MDYEGYEYFIVQTASPSGYQWTVPLDGARDRSGGSHSRKIVVFCAERAIEFELKKACISAGKD